MYKRFCQQQKRKLTKIGDQMFQNSLKSVIDPNWTLPRVDNMKGRGSYDKACMVGWSMWSMVT